MPHANDSIVVAWINDRTQPNPPRLRAFVAAYHQATGAKRDRRDYLAVAASAGAFAVVPIVGAIFGAMGWPQAIAIIAGLALTKTVGHFASKSSVFRTSPHYRETNTLLQRVGELLDECEIRDHDTPEKKELRTGHYIEAVLSIIETLILRLTDVEKGRVTVTFARYSPDGTMLDIRYRNRGSERGKKEVPVDDSILAHRVCAAGKRERTVDDFDNFPDAYHKSPTMGQVNYRSFFVFPIYRDDDPKAGALGFVSIDCEIPYAFFGNRATLLSTAVAPLVTSIGARIG